MAFNRAACGAARQHVGCGMEVCGGGTPAGVGVENLPAGALLLFCG